MAKSVSLKPKKKKVRRSASKLMEPTASSMMKVSGFEEDKKSVRSMRDWVNGLRGLKPPPKRSKAKSKKKKPKGPSLKSVARSLKKKFVKSRAKKSKKKPISKSRSKAKGKSAKRGKTATKKKAGLKKKKGKKGKTPAKKKKVKKKKPKKKAPEPETPQVAVETIMLGGNDAGEREKSAENRNQQFFQEMRFEPEPEVTNLQVQIAGEIDREDERETGVIYSMSNNERRLDLENQPGMHLEYQTDDGEQVKLEFGPEDQIIEHIFTMHWSQVDKILLRAKVAGKVAPPSKRMTILEVGRDVYSKERNMLGGGSNVLDVQLEGRC